MQPVQLLSPSSSGLSAASHTGMYTCEQFSPTAGPALWPCQQPIPSPTSCTLQEPTHTPSGLSSIQLRLNSLQSISCHLNLQTFSSTQIDSSNQGENHGQENRWTRHPFTHAQTLFSPLSSYLPMIAPPQAVVIASPMSTFSSSLYQSQ